MKATRAARSAGAAPTSSRPSTLDEWAALTGLSRRTITRLFRRETGMSFAA